MSLGSRRGQIAGKRSVYSKGIGLKYPFLKSKGSCWRCLHGLTHGLLLIKTFCSIPVLLLMLALLMPAPVVVADVLGNCRAQHAALDQVHDCLDSYLDLMDQNLSDLDAYISDQLSLDDQALSAFRRSQDAFEEFRRENCLWYCLLYTSPSPRD